MRFFDAFLGYNARMSYKDNCDPRSKSRTADENAAALYNLMKKSKVNLTESEELHALYYNREVKERTDRPGDSVWLSGKNKDKEKS